VRTFFLLKNYIVYYLYEIGGVLRSKSGDFYGMGGSLRFDAVFFCPSELDCCRSITVCAYGCPYGVRLTRFDSCRLCIKEPESLRAYGIDNIVKSRLVTVIVEYHR
jgi:hypothetical protein